MITKLAGDLTLTRLRVIGGGSIARQTFLDQIHRAQEYVCGYRPVDIHPRFQLPRAHAEFASQGFHAPKQAGRTAQRIDTNGLGHGM